jgi:MFS family permease
MHASPVATVSDYLGVFLVALATLMLEVLLTRIFSVTLWYHLAFVAVSIAMFGMTLGAVLVYLFSRWFTPARARLNLTISSVLFGVSAVWAVDAHLRFAVNPALITSPLTQLSVAYGLISIPFIFSGIAISIALTQFPSQTSRLYAVDLAGAALGCVLLILVLDLVGGPRAVEVVAIAGALASLTFLYGLVGKQPWRSVGFTLAILAAFVVTFRLTLDRSVRELGYEKGSRRTKPYYEKWNSYSRIAVQYPKQEPPFGWGLSDTYQPTDVLNQLRLNIDGSAETVLTRFGGNLDTLQHLKYDITNIAHYLTDGGRVFVVGAGGGRDVLSALVFNQRSVVAVEMNRAIIEAVNDVFGDLTGHLDRHEKVRFVNDEARSYLARSNERFDLIQISLIDTWAATAAGAFVLSENTLYTTDAWKLFLDRMTPEGILSVSRWYGRPVPAEMYKVAALATNSLRASGIPNARQHVMVVATGERAGESAPGVSTLLMKRTPFTEDEVNTIESVAKEMNFDVMLTPRSAADAAFVALSDERTIDQFVATFTEGDLSSPNDDRPFFFKMDAGLLNGLFTFVGTLTLAFIVLPVFLKAEPRVLRDNIGLSLAFAAIGLGFMLVEIAQMQRLILLLGHPTFSLSVVLFGLLIASGLGSFATERVTPPLSSIARARLITLIGILVVVGLLTPLAARLFQGVATPLRILVALLLLMPAGFFMGMAFPIAMKIGLARRPSMTPWLWGINGATSVTASVLAVMISSAWGISAAWWSGVACYVLAAVMIVWSARQLEQMRST